MARIYEEDRGLPPAQTNFATAESDSAAAGDNFAPAESNFHTAQSDSRNAETDFSGAEADSRTARTNFTSAESLSTTAEGFSTTPGGLSTTDVWDFHAAEGFSNVAATVSRAAAATDLDHPNGRESISTSCARK